MDTKNMDTKKQATPTKDARNVVVFGLMVAVAAVAAIVVAAQLHSYGVPVLLVLTAGLAIGASVLEVLARLHESVTTSTYNCPAATCSWQVRLTRPTAEDTHRVREAATTHPDHPLV
ncbi:hypothetical protein PJ985_17855 [Streptomyces sp. ACA25]|uniref:hypothetical protein n=1 Tax=Streptomyces sp. ACA25 TaxID=3022596 RepID=UPI00230777F5|nr:hypothetical protein [Streptomyces sp. ACA25]MDB1089430.1 hypothetical protein [Streptomyces sp. ACA25]